VLAQPNYPHLCRLPAEALAADWSLHLQLVAWEGETTNTESPDNRAECLLPTTCSNWDFEGQKDGELWKELEAGLKHPKKKLSPGAASALEPLGNDVVGWSY